MFKKILLVSLPISLQLVYSADIFPYSVSWLWAVLLAMSVLLLFSWLYRHKSANQNKIEAKITEKHEERKIDIEQIDNEPIEVPEEVFRESIEKVLIDETVSIDNNIKQKSKYNIKYIEIPLS